MVLSSFLLLTGCNKWLDVELADKVTQDELFSTPQGYREALAGVYAQMASERLYGQKLSMEIPDLLAQYYSYTGVSSKYEKLKGFDYKD